MADTTSFLPLLEEAFPGMGATIVRCEKIGYPWNSTPFVKKQEGVAISHVGLLDYPMVIQGVLHNVGAIHAVSTKAAYRRQGYASDLLQEALHFAEKRYECTILFTEIPAFYKKFSFRYLEEHRFHLPCKASQGTKSLLPVSSPKDDPLFRHCFQNRAALSHLLWIKDQGTIASYNTLFATYPMYWSLHYSPFFSGFLSYEIKNRELHLFDIIASKIPSLEVILDHLPAAIDVIYFYFSPDLLTDKATAQPYLYDHGHFLVHGNFPKLSPFMIPPLSRC